MPNILPNVNPLSYLGVRAETPSNCVVQKIPPSSNDKPEVGSFVVDEAARIGYQLMGYVNGVPDWQPIGGGGAAIQTINLNAPIAGNYTLAGTANQITVAQSAGTSTFSIPSAFIAPGSIASTTSITAGTTLTATLGNITATNGNFVASTAGTGILLNSPATSGAAPGPVVVNGRSGRATFTGVSIAAAADLTLTITNSAITGATTQIVYSMSGSTTGSAPSIKSVTNSAGSSAIVVTNGTGATTTTADIVFDFIVLN